MGCIGETISCDVMTFPSNDDDEDDHDYHDEDSYSCHNSNSHTIDPSIHQHEVYLVAMCMRVAGQPGLQASWMEDRALCSFCMSFM